MRVIDIEKWERRKSYLWFSGFSNPTYSITVRLNVTKLIGFKGKYKSDFYADMLYLTIKALNSVSALKLRVEGQNVVEYEAPAPSFTVALENGLFDVCRIEWIENPDIFRRQVREGIEKTKKEGGNKGFGDDKHDVYYFSCLPWLDFTEATNPIPDDKESLSVPRISWGKYVENGNGYEMSMNITVSHALVDGKPLCDVFNAVQKNIDNCESLLNGEKHE